METLMIEAEGLTKRYGETQALGGIDLAVPAGTVLGLLGPNGAGKTTAVRILTTLATPDGGGARIAGHDVVREARQVRRSIGVTAQDTTLDEALTGRQNLRMVAELSGLRRSAAVARTRELLDRFELTYAADRLVKGYSGGMRRRLDLAAGLVTHPPVLFLDEPTTGLDPASRARMWEVIQELIAQGTTLLLTTQYLEEADALADQIVVVNHGRIIASGTASELKAATGGARLEVTLTHPHPGALAALRPLTESQVDVSRDGRRLRASVATGASVATAVIRALDAAGALVDDVVVHPPSLDDVFFALTGASAQAADAAASAEDVGSDQLQGVSR
ncbi:daunorubicin resistance protein DrrA family ABC transporter ATP-binding protein [Frankia sp. QA3]|uniref:daunorubicin resistance protein DrrA family ABC transporter ATP-binding protein n=1 Tax=Frankia sp. QA3 TaxID=710111 RepID=UPI000269C048|nr:daunorubicin resistance protein DrrA family ABC transporter ATP-binding protein [Frankia sp. QA3]EIV91997.1 daunorubicin resistance ABC transporter ATP-binding subunit [Frankia sp. QA3]